MENNNLIPAAEAAKMVTKQSDAILKEISAKITATCANNKRETYFDTYASGGEEYIIENLKKAGYIIEYAPFGGIYISW